MPPKSLDVARRLYQLAALGVAPARLDWGLSVEELGRAPQDDEPELELIEVNAEEYLEVDGKIVVTVRTLSRDTRSGTLVEERHYEVLTIEDGRLLDCEQHLDRDEALSAARSASS